MSAAAPPPVTYRVQHLTTYRYSQPVSLARHLLHLSPRPGANQEVLAHQIQVAPLPTVRREWLDSFGNPVLALALERDHDVLRVSAESLVRVAPRPRPTAEAALTVADVRRWLAYGGGAPAAASAFAFPSPHVLPVAGLDAWVERFLPPEAPVVAALDALTAAIHAEFRYDPRATAVGTPVAEVLERGAGVCQDFAHLFLACVRRAGLAARYISGYLLTTPPPGQPRLRGADASHAWVAAALPGSVPPGPDGQDGPVDWLECDPTNGGRVDERYIVLGWGRDFGDVSPLRGVLLGGGEHRLEVQVTVSPEGEAGDPQEAFPAVAGFGDHLAAKPL